MHTGVSESRQYINPRPDGVILGGFLGSLDWVFPARRLGGGVGVQSVPAICQTTGSILDPKTILDRPGHVYAGYFAKFCLNVTDDVTDQVER